MLYICPTPIGNLEDITIRTLNVFKEVDEIYCEDTRRSIKLFNHYEIKKPLYSLHEHNEIGKSEEVINKLKKGLKIAYVSDAGMPGISDPGAKLIFKAIQNNIDVITLPGPSAMLVALVNSGLDTRYFSFVGFLERDNNSQKNQLKELSKKRETLIIYESPHRIKDTLKKIYDIFGDRKIVIARELTKKFEEYIRTTLLEINKLIAEEKKDFMGEIILIIEGNNIKEEEKQFTDEQIIKLIKENLEKGISKKDSVKEVVKKYGISKNKVYELSINL